MNRKFLIALVLMPVVLFPACENREKNPDPGEKDELSDAFVRLITLDTVKVEDVRNEILLTGKITYDENHLARISPITGGKVESMKVELGDYVKKGQVLAVIRGIENAEFSNQLASSRSNLEIAKKNAELNSDLYKNGLASEKDYLASEQDLVKATAELQRIKDIVSIYGDESAKTYTVRSPIDGYVVERNITRDMVFRSDEGLTTLFTISDLRHVWVIGNVSETDIPDVQPGYKVRVTTVSYPDKIYEGVIARTMNVIDSASKVMKVRIELANPDYLLKPEMFANIIVYYREDDKHMAAVPSEAIIFDRNRNYVMVSHGRGKIETREVSVYHATGNRTYIESGLKEGELIVCRNALVVYNAMNN